MLTAYLALISTFLVLVFLTMWLVGRRFGEVRTVIVSARTPGENCEHLWVQVREMGTGEPKWLRLTRRQFHDAQAAAANNSQDNPF
jgi:hypothetical protein